MRFKEVGLNNVKIKHNVSAVKCLSLTSPKSVWGEAYGVFFYVGKVGREIVILSYKTDHSSNEDG